METAFAHEQSEFGPVQPVNADMGACCIAAVWLVHDFLDESHEISQGIDTPSGSFWHGILHRREGDYSNAKYWFRHVGQHEVFELLGQRAGELAAIRGDVKAVEKLDARGSVGSVRVCRHVPGGRARRLEARRSVPGHPAGGVGAAVRLSAIGAAIRAVVGRAAAPCRRVAKADT